MASKAKTNDYWVYQTNIGYHGNTMIQAKLLTPTKFGDKVFSYGKDDSLVELKSPMQLEPYQPGLKLVYQVNPKHIAFDNYVETHGFNLYSEKLIKLMKEFEVKFESFPVEMVDKEGKKLTGLEYHVFHPLLDYVDAMDKEKSHWSGKDDRGVNGLILKEKFKEQPIFLLEDICIPLMRDDLKQEIEKKDITGFGFLRPSRYKSGKYGFAPDFND